MGINNLQEEIHVIAKEEKYTEIFLKSFSPEPAGQIQLNLIQIIFG
jgi:hypothetical protein